MSKLIMHMNTAPCDRSWEYLSGHKNIINYLIFTKNQFGLKHSKTSEKQRRKKNIIFLGVSELSTRINFT